MFTEVRPGVVASDEGFEVADLGVRYVTYREAERVLKIPKDIGADNCRYYLRELPRWQPPYEDVAIPPTKAAEIRARVIAAMEFRGRPFHTDLNDAGG